MIKMTHLFSIALMAAGLILARHQPAAAQDHNSHHLYAAMEFPAQATVRDSLTRYAMQANRLWNQKESNLDFAADFLAIVSRTRAERLYRNASLYYFWSLANANFDAGRSAVEREVQYLLPLVPDSTGQQWKGYLAREDPRLFDAIAGFWKRSDPYASTGLNERLIEHWKRIEYARRHFTRGTDSPYGTDQRGVIYVRFGAPDMRIRKNIYLNGVIDPVSYQNIRFELGNVVRSEVELWKYERDGEDDWLYMFGHRDGSGEYGQRLDVLELIDTQGLRVQLGGGNWMSSAKMRRFSERVAQYGLYETLAPYDPYFKSMYQDMRTGLVNNAYLGLVQRYLSAPFVAEGLVRTHFARQAARVPAGQTTLRNNNEILTTRTQLFRFLNQQNQTEYLLSVQATPGDSLRARAPQFLSNRLYVYDENWKLLDQINQMKAVDRTSIATPLTYTISSELLKQNIYYASELIDTTRSGIVLPGQVSTETAGIIASTGKKKLELPPPMERDGQFAVSDVVIGKGQEPRFGERMPITPSLDYRFTDGAEVMLYFEVYNIPVSGYSYTYYFKKDRWLIGQKDVEKSQVTILGDKVQQRDTQLFTISLDELDPGSYQLILEFSLLGEAGGDAPVLQRTIDFTIVEER